MAFGSNVWCLWAVSTKNTIVDIWLFFIFASYSCWHIIILALQLFSGARTKSTDAPNKHLLYDEFFGHLEYIFHILIFLCYLLCNPFPDAWTSSRYIFRTCWLGPVFDSTAFCCSLSKQMLRCSKFVMLKDMIHRSGVCFCYFAIIVCMGGMNNVLITMHNPKPDLRIGDSQWCK